MRSLVAATLATSVRDLGAIHLPATIVGTALALALTACGSAGSDTAELAGKSSAGESASSSATASGDKDEQITPGGIAVVVLEHLGRDAVQQFATYEPEPGSVSVMIRLRGGERDGYFTVGVYSPEYDEFGRAGECPPKRRTKGMGKLQCRTLANGTIVMTSETPFGFSDDNSNGMVVSGTSATTANGTAMAMYESYDKSPSVSVADLDSLLADPRLTWVTDPGLNDAGEDVDVKEASGG